MATDIEDRLLTVAEGAQFLGLTCGRVYDLVRQNLIPAVHAGRQVRLSRRQLALWVEAGGTSLPGGWRRGPTPAQGGD